MSVSLRATVLIVATLLGIGIALGATEVALRVLSDEQTGPPLFNHHDSSCNFKLPGHRDACAFKTFWTSLEPRLGDPRGPIRIIG